MQLPKRWKSIDEQTNLCSLPTALYTKSIAAKAQKHCKSMTIAIITKFRPLEEVTMNRLNRPVGVTIIGILQIIGGAFTVIASLAALVGGSAFLATQSSEDVSLIAGVGVGLGIVFLVVGALSIIIGIGMLKLKPWAWLWTLVLQGVNAVLGAIALISGDASQIIGLAIAGIIFYYLLRPEVKAAFGRV